jgi:hypothetical protein
MSALNKSIINKYEALEMAEAVRTNQLIDMTAKRRRSVERALYYRKLARERGEALRAIYRLGREHPGIGYSIAFLADNAMRDQGESR